MADTMRGIWKCRTDQSKRYSSQNTRANIWVKTGKVKFESPTGCGFWNVYVSTVPIENDSPRRKIDLRCMNCNRRVKFIAARGTARGRQRPITWLRRPSYEPAYALRKEARARNALDERTADLMKALEAGEITEEDLPGFIQASRLNAQIGNQ
jgi:hypothetical protein